jgi:hypothetical protein
MKNLFERVLFEADGDNINNANPDDVNMNNTTGPPDIGENNNTDEPTGDLSVDDPPDVGEDYSNMDNFDGDASTDPNDGDNTEEDLGLDEKISNVMNENLYQRFLSLAGNITNQLSVLKDNNDIIYTSAPKSLGIIESLKKLRENINLYLAYYFINNNYSKNLLFFNKCLNLLNLLNKNFEKDLKQGVNE